MTENMKLPMRSAAVGLTLRKIKLGIYLSISAIVLNTFHIKSQLHTDNVDKETHTIERLRMMADPSFVHSSNGERRPVSLDASKFISVFWSAFLP